MALSKPVVPVSVEEIPVIAQHYLECGNANCERNVQFYCNPCHQPMCDQCRDEHQNSPKTKNHEVVPYRQRKRQLPEEKCSDHPNKDIDVLCEDCKVPLCSKCALQVHRKHSLIDLETFYSERFNLYNDGVYKINQHFLPTSQDIQKDVSKDTKNTKAAMDKIRTYMKAEAETLKSLVDTVTSENIEQVNSMEELLMKELQSQDNTYKDYISYLGDLVRDFYGFLASTKIHNNPIIVSLLDHLNIRPIPETTKPDPPVFTAGQYSKKDVAKLLGRVTVPNNKPEKRKIKCMETALTQLKPTGKQNRQKSDVKQTLSLSSSVTKVGEYTIQGVECAFYISLGKSGTLWVSDHHGTLVQTDMQGLIRHEGLNSCGCHTVTQDGGLIYMYSDRYKQVIYRRTLCNEVTKLIETNDWYPFGLHSSNINGDILVGMVKGEEEAKVTRYNETGEEIQNIQRDNKGQELYRYPNYITENINGDICTSDYKKEAVVVVNKSGQYRFDYTNRESGFIPFDIRTDVLGHILVCDNHNKTVLVLNQDGQFLCQLLTKKKWREPISLCVDDDNNLIVGQYETNTVKVYKYLQ